MASEVMAEFFVRDVSGTSFAPGSSWESVGEVKLVAGGVRFQEAVQAAQSAGQTWITLDVDSHRFHGKCRCKRTVTALLRERVSLGQRDGCSIVKSDPVNLDALDTEATVVACPECAATVRLQRLKGKLNAEHLCDARCTNAKGSNCECECGGANHGAAWGI